MTVTVHNLCERPGHQHHPVRSARLRLPAPRPFSADHAAPASRAAARQIHRPGAGGAASTATASSTSRSRCWPHFHDGHIESTGIVNCNRLAVGNPGDPATDQHRRPRGRPTRPPPERAADRDPRPADADPARPTRTPRLDPTATRDRSPRRPSTPTSVPPTADLHPHSADRRRRPARGRRARRFPTARRGRRSSFPTRTSDPDRVAPRPSADPDAGAPDQHAGPGSPDADPHRDRHRPADAYARTCRSDADAHSDQLARRSDGRADGQLQPAPQQSTSSPSRWRWRTAPASTCSNVRGEPAAASSPRAARCSSIAPARARSPLALLQRGSTTTFQWTGRLSPGGTMGFSASASATSAVTARSPPAWSIAASPARTPATSIRRASPARARCSPAIRATLKVEVRNGSRETLERYRGRASSPGPPPAPRR